MHIVEFTAGSLRFVDAAPERAPDDGFVWIYLDRTDFVRHLADVQAAAQRLGGSALLDVHVKDLASDSHPSHYDATSVYDMVIFRRLATLAEVQRDQEQVNAIASYHAHGVGASALTKPLVPEAFSRIDSRADSADVAGARRFFSSTRSNSSADAKSAADSAAAAAAIAASAARQAEQATNTSTPG